MVMTIVVPVVPVMTLKGTAGLVYAAYVPFPEYTASRSTVPIGSAVVAAHCAVVPETVWAEHPAMLEYAEPFVEYSKFTVLPELLFARVAVMVSGVPTTTGDVGETDVMVVMFV